MSDFSAMRKQYHPLRILKILVATWVVLPPAYYYGMSWAIQHTDIANYALARTMIVNFAKAMGAINIWPL